MWRDFILKLEPTATFFESTNSDQIAEVEVALGIEIPSQLKEMLYESNGVHGSYGLGLIWPIERIEKVNLSMRNDPKLHTLYMPFDSLLFFADAGNGDQFAYGIIGGQIRFANIYAWNHEDDSRKWVAPSLDNIWNGGCKEK